MQSKTEMQQGWEFAAGIMGADIAAHMGREYVSAIEAAIKQLEENINNHQYRNEPPQIVRTAQKTPPKQGLNRTNLCRQHKKPPYAGI